MTEKGQLIEKARKLGLEYLPKYGGCAQTTLLAVAETLGMEVPDNVFKSMLGLSGLTGGCGGICGATAAIGLRYGINREEYLKDSEMRDQITEKIMQTVRIVRDRMSETYGGYLCCDIQRKLYGRSYDFIIPEEMEAYSKEPVYERCSNVTEDAAGWTVEALLNTE